MSTTDSPPSARARSITVFMMARCPTWTPSKFPIVRTGRTSARLSLSVPATVSNATLPVVRILSRYFATRFFVMYAVGLVVSTLTIVVIEMLLNLDDMLSNNREATAPLRYLMPRIPS